MSSHIRRLEQTLLNRLPVSWQRRLRHAHAGHKTIVRSMAWLTMFVLAAKAIAALKEVAIAYRFGTSEVLEGYLLVFNLATTLVSLLFSVMHFVLVPALARSQLPESVDWQRQITTWIWVVALAAGGLVALGLAPLIQQGWLGLTENGRQAALVSTPIMGVITTLGIIASWHACQLMARQQHANTFFEAMPALGIMLCVMVLPSPTVGPLLWGTVLGFAVQWVLLVKLAKASGMPVVGAPSLSWPHEQVSWKIINTVFAAQGLMSVGGIIDQIILAHLPAGELAAFGYANRVMAVMLTLSATVISRAFLPVLSGLSAHEAYVVVRRWLWPLFAVGGFLALFFTFFSESLVSFLFQRGAFDVEDSKTTSAVLKVLALQLPFYLTTIALIQWISAQSYRVTMLIKTAAINIVLKIMTIYSAFFVLEQSASIVAFGIVAGYCGVFLYVWLYLRIYANKVPQKQKELNRRQYLPKDSS